MLEVTPSANAQCGAAGTVLRLAATSPEPQGPTCAGDACGAVTIALGDTRTSTLPVDHDWAVYAERRDGDAGMFLGHLHLGNPDTALRRLLGHPEGTWFDPRWTAGSFRLARGRTLQDHTDAWDEWQVAAAAHELWLTELPADNRAASNVRILGAVTTEPGGEAMLLPDAVVREALRAHYGQSAEALVPTVDEWNGIVSDLQVCMVPRYEREAAAALAHLPPDARCARLSGLVGPMQLGTGATSNAQACVRSRAMRITHTVSGTTEDQTDVCVPLRLAPGANTQTAVSLPFVVVGDVLTIREPPGAVQVCIDNHCESLPPSGNYPLNRPGLVEIRLGERAESANALQGVALARFAAIDPASQWHPVGLYVEHAARSDRPWSTLDYDERDIFAFARRRHSLTFQFSASPLVAGVANAPIAGDSAHAPFVTADIPVVAPTDVPMPSPPPSALAVLITRDHRCPTALPAQVRRDALLDPHALTVDEHFTTFLAQYTDEQHPYRCLARADFRVRHDLTLIPAHDAGWFQLGLAGDPRLTVHFTRPTGIALAYPLGYAFARLPSPSDWFHWNVDASASLVAGLAFSDASMIHTGLAFSVSLEFGFWRLSRLVGIGFMVHALGITTSEDEHRLPLSGFVSLNIGSLIDLAGAR